MSASTVAIGTNPTVMKNSSLVLDSNSNIISRRRRVTSAEKKSNIENFSEGGFSGSRGDRVEIGKDLGLSIRPENVFERQKDLSEHRIELMNSTVSPRRRKVVLKPGKPRWRTFISVLTKNLVLLLALLWLGRKIRNWVVESDHGIISPNEVSDFEGQISEVEALLKTTAKMMQAQVEVVDKKIESEIGSLRREMTKKVEEKSALVENELNKLGDRTDSLDKSLADLRNEGYLSKEEFERFLNELETSKDREGSDEDLNLDKISALAREIVEKEIEKHAADGLGRVDYALASGGARVVRHSEPFLFEKASSWLPAVKSRNGVHYTAHKMLEPGFGQPGQCFALKGSTGFVDIRLRAAIIPEAITLEHVARNVAYDRSSAPKDCQISAWFQGHDDDTSVQVNKMLILEFTYDLEKSNAQTFNMEASDPGFVDMVRLDFASNHGNAQHTCIYRLRVHGYEPDSLATLAI